MNRFIDTEEHPPQDASREITPVELAKFLLQLADLYASPESGNPSLAKALRKLASTVRRTEAPGTRGGSAKNKKIRERSLEQIKELKELDHDSIRAFLNDDSKTKDQLLDLASARFSMPVSQLKRMKTIEVRQAINSALLHESSIEILSEEAGRDGANRKS
jgi:hypothetical protein